MITQFARHPDVTEEAVGSMRSVIDSSPSLIGQLNSAAGSRRLTGFEPLPEGTHAGGEYNPNTRSIRLPTGMLNDTVESAFVLGHEVQHALNAPGMAQAQDLFFHDLGHAAESDQDYTAPVQDLINATRQDEASANLAGWNAMVEHLRSQHPKLSLQDIAERSARTGPFLQRKGIRRRYQPRSNLSMNQDQQFPLTPQNIEGMGQNYFDLPATETQLGHLGTSDYANYYGAWATSAAIDVHRTTAPDDPARPETPMRLDLAGAGLSRQTMEENGINFGRAARTPMPYVDGSTTPPTYEHFHHTADTHRYVPEPPPSQHAGVDQGQGVDQARNGDQGRHVDQGLNGDQALNGDQGTAASRPPSGPELGAPQLPHDPPTRLPDWPAPEHHDVGTQTADSLRLANLSFARPATEAARPNPRSDRGQRGTPVPPRPARSASPGKTTGRDH